MKRSQASSARKGLGPVPTKKLPKTPKKFVSSKKVPPQEKHEQDEEESPSKAPVRYITEGLIKQTTGKDSLNDILSLRLSVRKDDGKKIRYIENLDGLKRLQVLNLSFNQIQKMERLGHLGRLRDLDLSCNCIARIEGLETLLHLQFLNLSHNLIESIPAWLGKRLKALREFHIEGNLLFSLSDISRLRPLKDLINLTMSSNAVSELAHYRLYAVFHLRSLGQLDGAQVTEEQRHQADERFGQEEIENLEIELEARNKRFEALETDHTTTLDEKKKTEDKAQALKKKTVANKEKLNELENELKAKDELLRRKTAELTKACEKQFRLEQELAFHKIDAKFEPFPEAAFMDQIDGGTEESAYVGQASYRRNQFASEQYLTPRSQQLRYHHTPQSGDIDASVRKQLNETLDTTLADKEKHISRAEERLKALHKQVGDAEDQVRILNERILRAGRERDAKPPMEEEERFRLEGQLADRLHAVVGLRDRMAQLEDSMQATLDIIEDKDREMAHLRQQLALLQEGDPRYAELAAQLADRELQAAHATKNYSNLKHDLDNTLGRLTAEMDRVKGLEQQLVEGQADLNNELREELQGIVGGLTEYLAQVKGQVAEQQRENARLQQERQQLLERLAETERAKEEEKQRETGVLKKQLRDAEDALQEFEADNEAMRKSQREMSKTGPEKDARLREALEEATRLKDALRKQQRQAEAEKTALEDELAARRDDAVRAVSQARSAGDKDAEARATAAQLAEAQAANRALRDRLRDQQVQYDDLMNSSLFPEEVAQRISHVGDTLEASREGDESLLLGPEGEGDVVGTSLAGLQGQVFGRLRDAQQEADRAKRYKQKAEGEVKSLKHQLEEMQGRLRDMAARDQDHIRRPETDREDEAEMERMKEELRRLKDALRNQKPPARATHTDSRSAAPVADPRVTEQMQRLHGDLNDLRNQLQNKDRMAAQQMSDAERAIQQLQAELQRRDHEAQEADRATRMELERRAREAERKQASVLAQAERQAGELARKAVDELAKAQNQVEGLEDLLANRERELETTLHQGETASQAVAEQQEEIGALHDVLGAQRDEILRLQDLLEGLGSGQGSPPSPQAATDLENLLGEIGALRQALHGQQTHMADRGRGVATGAPMPPMGGRGFPVQQPMVPPPQPSFIQQHQPAPFSHTDGSFAPQSMGYGPPPSMVPPAPPVAQAPLGTSSRPSVRFAPPEQVQYMHAPLMQPQSQNIVPLVAPTGQMHAPPQGGAIPIHVAPQGTAVPVNVPLQGSAIPLAGTVGQNVHQPHSVNVPSESHVHQQGGIQDRTMSGSRRGKLRRVEGPVEGLFCNVPEHHDMEDELSRLRKRLEKLKRTKVQLQSDRRSSGVGGSGSRMRQDLLDKREELDALDLAVTRRQGALKRLQEDDDDLRHQKEARLRELHELDRAVNDRRSRRDFLNGRQRFQPQEEDYDLVDDYRLLQRSGFLEDEVECLEDTLAKRKAELREADRLLLQCQTDLHDAKEKASQTLREYDEATRNLALTREEREELELRSHEVAVGLVKVQEQLLSAQEEAGELEEKRGRKEQDLSEVETLLGSRETELRAVDAKRDQSSKRLEKLNSEVIIAEHKLSELQSILRDGEREQSNRQSELDRLQDQIDNQRHVLAEVNRDIGGRQSDLQTLTSEVDKHRTHLVSALEDGEREIALTQQKIKDTRSQLDRLKVQRRETAETVDQRREELSALQGKISAAQGVLHDAQSAIDKQRAELKHTLEMVQIEKTELEALRLQHEAKMAELEKTQLTSLQERASLEKLQEDEAKSRTSAEVMREEMRRVKEERNKMVAKKRALEESIIGLTREEGALREDCDSLEMKLGQLKITHNETQEGLHLNQCKLDSIQQDLVAVGTELEDTKRRKSEMIRELQTLKQHVKENRSELKHTNADLEEDSQQQTRLQAEIEQLVQQKAELASQLDQMSEGLDQHRTTLEDCHREERIRQDALSKMGRQLEQKQSELTDTQRELESVVEKVAQEKDQLSKIMNNASRETAASRVKLDMQQRDLDALTLRKQSLKTKLEQNVADLGHIDELEMKINDLETEISSGEREKERLLNELESAKAQAMSLGKEKERIESERNHIQHDLKQLRTKWSSAQKDFKTEHRRLTQEIETLKVGLEEETKHTGRMSKEVDMWRQEYINTKQQLHSHEEQVDRETRIDSQIQHLKEEIHTEVNDGLRALELSRLEVLDELQEVHHQKAEISKKISGFKEIKLTSFQSDKENSLRKQLDMEFQLQQEQDFLKLQLDQQMSRQSEVLAGIKLKSESTIQSLRSKLENLEGLVSGSSSQSLSIRLSRRITMREDQRSIDLIPLRDTEEQGTDGVEGGLRQRQRSDDEGELLMAELGTRDLEIQRTRDLEVQRTKESDYQRTRESESRRALDLVQNVLDSNVERAQTFNVGRMGDAESERTRDAQQTFQRRPDADAVAQGRVKFGDSYFEGGERRGRERRRDGADSLQPRGILKKRSVPSRDEGAPVEDVVTGREILGSDVNRARARSEDLTASHGEADVAPRHRTHSYNHQRRASRSPSRRQPLSQLSHQPPERGPPSSQHWSEFMDSVNQLKDQKLAQLNTNTNTWDHR